MKLSDTQAKVLLAAAHHVDGLTTPPAIPAGARQKVGQALLKAALVRRVDRGAADARDLWTIGGDSMLLGLTEAGRAAVAGQGPQGAPQAPQEGAVEERAHTAPEAAQGAPQAPEPRQVAQELPEAAHGPRQAPRANLRDAAAAVLAVWDGEASHDDGIAAALEQPMTAMRAMLAGKPAREPRAPREAGTPRKAREGTKQEAVLALLRRTEGATIADIVSATGWQQHTVRGFFAGLKKRHGIEVTVLERIRQVGPNKTGAKGSYTIYRVGGSGAAD